MLRVGGINVALSFKRMFLYKRNLKTKWFCQYGIKILKELITLIKKDNKLLSGKTSIKQYLKPNENNKSYCLHQNKSFYRLNLI
jgi:hypothetical protein